MALRAEGFAWLAVLFAVPVWVLCAGPLAAQGGGRFEVGIAEEDQAPPGVTLSSPGAPATADAVIEEMSQAAGVIFAGQVMAVRRSAGFAGSSADAAEGIVEVDFRVDQGVRGPASGSVYTLREWAGLWDGNGGGRYRVGQWLLVFFFDPDAHGLSSPVRGRDGAVPLRGGGVAPGPDDTTPSAGQWMVDLRWVQAQALRRDALVDLPVRRPVPLRPGGFVPEELGGQEEAASTLVRRPPSRVPISTLELAAVETQPLTQVLALCARAVRQVDVAR